MRTYTLVARRATHGEGLDYEHDLNDQQRAVVCAGAGPSLVIAGAGSGKTHTLTYRVAYLIERGVDPSRVLLVTFTNKAARAMTERVGHLLGDDTRGLWSGTFHSIANRILRVDGHLLKYPRDFSILDTEDALTLLRTCAQEVREDAEDLGRLPQPKLLGKINSMCVNTGQRLSHVIFTRYPYFADQVNTIRDILKRYQSRKFDMALMDFDDLLLNWRRLLTEHEESSARWTSQFEHILVDEYQDTNMLQGQIIDLMASVHGNIMVVGDDSQSIYAFRGADYRNILEFPSRFPRCAQHKLEINYRSTPEILGLANRSIAHNTYQFPKTLQAIRPSGPRPALVTIRDVYQQAEFVCQRILELIDEGVALDEIAVLYRSHHHSMELQVALTRRHIPYVVRSGLRFFDQAHVKDALAYLRFLYNIRDEISFMRVAQQWAGVGARRSSQIWAYITSQPDPLAALSDEALIEQLQGRAKESWKRAAALFARLRKLRLMASPGALIMALIEGGYTEYAQASFDQPEARLSDLEQLADFAAQYADLDRFLGEISLLTTLSGQDVRVGQQAGPQEAVCLTSIHQAKGLEWSACFVLWLSDGQFPNPRVEEREEIEEERRLFYVAATRARDDLYLCMPTTHSSQQRGTSFLGPSPFVAELSEADPDREPWERWLISS